MKFYLSLLMILVFSGACKCDQTELTTYEKEWISVYKQGQTLIFKSDLNRYDTMTVKETRDFYTVCNMLEIGTTKFHIMSAQLVPNTCPDTNYCSIEINIRKEKQTMPALPFIRAFGLEYSPHIQGDQLTETDLGYIFQVGQNANGSGNNYLKSFVWNKHTGLAQYTNYRDETFRPFKN